MSICGRQPKTVPLKAPGAPYCILPECGERLSCIRIFIYRLLVVSIMETSNQQTQKQTTQQTSEQTMTTTAMTKVLTQHSRYRTFDAYYNEIFKAIKQLDPSDYFQFVNGDLNQTDMPLAHCISSDHSQHRGFALAIRQKHFPTLKRKIPNPLLIGTVRRQEIQPGCPKRHIINVITKLQYFNKPTLATLYSALYQLREYIIKHQLKELAMPMLGCGLDKLSPVDTMPMMIYLLSNLKCSIFIYTYEEHAYDRDLFPQHQKKQKYVKPQKNEHIFVRKPKVDKPQLKKQQQIDPEFFFLDQYIEEDLVIDYTNRADEYASVLKKPTTKLIEELPVIEKPKVRKTIYHLPIVRIPFANCKCMKNKRPCVSLNFCSTQWIEEVYKRSIQKRCNRHFYNKQLQPMLLKIHASLHQTAPKFQDEEGYSFVGDLKKVYPSCNKQHPDLQPLSQYHFNAPDFPSIKQFVKNCEITTPKKEKVERLKKVPKRERTEAKVALHQRIIRQEVKRFKDIVIENHAKYEVKRDFPGKLSAEDHAALVLEYKAKMYDKTKKRCYYYAAQKYDKDKKTSDVIKLLQEIQEIGEQAIEQGVDISGVKPMYRIDGDDVYFLDEYIGNTRLPNFSKLFWAAVEKERLLPKQQNIDIVNSAISKQIESVVAKYVYDNRFMIISALTDFILSLISTSLAIKTAYQHGASVGEKVIHILSLIAKAFNVVMTLMTIGKLIAAAEDTIEFKETLQASVVHWVSDLLPGDAVDQVRIMMNSIDTYLPPSRETIDKLKYEAPLEVRRFITDLHNIAPVPTFPIPTYAEFQETFNTEFHRCYPYAHNLPEITKYVLHMSAQDVTTIENKLISENYNFSEQEIMYLTHSLYSQINNYIFSRKNSSTEDINYIFNNGGQFYVNLRVVLRATMGSPRTPANEFHKLVLSSLASTLSLVPPFQQAWTSQYAPKYIPLTGSYSFHLLADTDLSYATFWPICKQQGISELSITTILSICTGLAAVGISIWDNCRGNAVNNGIGARVVMGQNTVRALKEQAKDMKALVEEISYDVFGYVLGTKHFIRVQGETYIEKLRAAIEMTIDTYVNDRSKYFELRDLIERCEKFQKGLSINTNELSAGEQATLASVRLVCLQATEKYNVIFETFKKISVRQVPVWYHFYGREGAGKTEFINRYIIPKIANSLGTPPGVYALNLDEDGNSFFPRYLGQDICLVDEFWKSQANDKLNGKLNNILNSAPYVMEGAGLQEKNQMCTFKLLLSSSNFATIDLNAQVNTNWTREWINPLLQRQRHVHVINTSQYDKTSKQFLNLTRDFVKHSESFEELRFVEYKVMGQDEYGASLIRKQLLDKIPSGIANKDGTLKIFDYEGRTNSMIEAQPIVSNIFEEEGYWYKLNFPTAQVYYKYLNPKMIQEEIISRIGENQRSFRASCKTLCEASVMDVANLDIFRKTLTLQGIPADIIESVWEEKRAIPEATKQQALYNSTEQLICHLYGESGKGKSYLLDQVGHDLHALHPQLPFIKVARIEDANDILCPSIVQIDDKITVDHGQLIMDIQERIPGGSIILYSSNIRVETYKVPCTYTLSAYSNTQDVGFFGRLPSYLVNTYIRPRFTVNVPYVITNGVKTYLNGMNEGWFRRIGISGITTDHTTFTQVKNVASGYQQQNFLVLFFMILLGILSYYAFGSCYAPIVIALLFLAYLFITASNYMVEPDNFLHTPFVTPQWNMSFNMTDRNLLRYTGAKKSIDTSHLVNILEEGYSTLITKSKDIKIIERDVHIIPPLTDVTIRVPRAQDLPHLLNNPLAIMKAVGSHGPTSVTLSSRLFKGQFMCAVNDWNIPYELDEEEIRRQAIRTYALMLDMNIGFTVAIITSDVVFYGHDGIIEFWRETGDHMTWKVSETMHENVPCVTFTMGTRGFSLDYPSVIEALEGRTNFIHKLRTPKVPNKDDWWINGDIPKGKLIASEKRIIISLKEQIIKLPGFPKNVQLRTNELTSMKEVSKTVNETIVKMQAFKKSVAMTIVLSLLGVAGVAGTIYLAWMAFGKKNEVVLTDAQKICKILDENTTISFYQGDNNAFISGSMHGAIRVANNISILVSLDNVKGYSQEYLQTNDFSQVVIAQFKNYLTLRCGLSSDMFTKYRFMCNYYLSEDGVFEFVSEQQAIAQVVTPVQPIVEQVCTKVNRFPVEQDWKVTWENCQGTYDDDAGEYTFTMRGRIDMHPTQQISNVMIDSKRNEIYTPWVIPFNVHITPSVHGVPRVSVHVYDEHTIKNNPGIKKQYEELIEDVIKMTFDEFRSVIACNVKNAIIGAMAFDKPCFEPEVDYVDPQFERLITKVTQQSDVGFAKIKRVKHARYVVSRMGKQDLLVYAKQQNLCNSTPLVSSFVQNSFSTYSKVRANMVKVICTDTGMSAYGIGIKGRLLLANLHVVRGSKEIKVENCEGNGHVPQYFGVTVLHTDPLNDIILLEKNGGEQFKDIVNKFMPDAWYKYLDKPGYFLRHAQPEPLSIRTNLQHKTSYDRGIPFSSDGNIDTHKGKVVVSNFLETSFTTSNGDCGLPYLVENLGDMHICGIHTLGVSSFSRAFAILLTKEQVEYYLTQAEKQEEVTQQAKKIQVQPGLVHVAREQVVKECTATAVFMDAEWTSVLNFDYGLPEHEFPLFRPNQFNHGVIENSNTALQGYTKEFSDSQFSKSSHIPSLFAYDLETELHLENPKRNAIFRPELVPDPSQLIKATNSDKRSIILTQCSFYNDVVRDDPEIRGIVTIAARDIKLLYDSWYPESQTRIMTWHETINGFFCVRDVLHGSVESINLETGPGATLSKFYNIHDKQLIFCADVEATLKTKPANCGRVILNTNPNTVVGRKVSQDIISKKVLARQGQWLAFPCKGSLKDETLKLAKVETGKTRLFEAADIRDVLFHRRYFGGLAGSMKLNRRKASAQIGTDAATEFNLIYRDFLCVANKGEAGDFKNYDKHIAHFVIRAFVDTTRFLVERTMTPEMKKKEAKTWDILFYDLCFSYSFVDGYLLQYARGNRSGAFTTTLLNSFANDIMHLCVTRHILGQIPQSVRQEKGIALDVLSIFKNCPIKTLGDDKIQVIDFDHQKYLGFQEISEAYKKLFGMTYTNPDKVKDSVTNLVDLKEMSFLSRRFNFDPHYDVILPTLKETTLLGMLFWSTSNSRDIVESTLMNARKEFQLVPKDQYDRMSNIFNYCVRIARQRFDDFRVLALLSFEENMIELKQTTLQ